MANVPLTGAIIKPETIVIHYPFLCSPMAEPFCPIALSEYLRWGWKQALSNAGDALHLIHPAAPYRARA